MFSFEDCVWGVRLKCEDREVSLKAIFVYVESEFQVVGIGVVCEVAAEE
jgi:hypothetical protein